MITKDKGCTTRVLYRGFKTNDFILKLIPNSGKECFRVNSWM